MGSRLINGADILSMEIDTYSYSPVLKITIYRIILSLLKLQLLFVEILAMGVGLIHLLCRKSYLNTVCRA